MSMQQVPSHRRVVVGVDTHKYVHVAVAIDELGTILDSRSFVADAGGYTQLIEWAAAFGGKLTFGIEGTGSYGAGLAGAVRRHGIGALEVMRTDRRDHRLRGKSDTLDAENAAKAVLAGLATAVPKSHDGVVEMIRQIKVAKDIAVKARTAAMISLKQVIVNAPDDLRQELQHLSRMALINRCASLRPGKVTTITASHETHATSDRQTLAAAQRRDQRAREAPEGTHLPGSTRPHRGVRRRTRHRRRDADRRRRQPRTRQVRSGIRSALRRRTGPRLLRHDHPPPTQPRRSPPSQRGALPSRNRPHAAPRAHQGLRRQTQRRGQDQSRDHPLPKATPRPRTLGRHAAHTRRKEPAPAGRLTAIGAS